MVIVRSLSFFARHKKKTVFFGVSGFFGARYLSSWLQERSTIRNYCVEASTYGSKGIHPEQKPRRITVLLNTRAHDGKAKTYFEKYALPLLLLAGLQVDVIQPEDGDRMIDYAQALDHQETDALYVVGGDATLSKVVTGCLNRMSSSSKLDPSPLIIGVFPGGHHNYSTLRFYPESIEFVDRACQSAMSLIKQTVKHVPAMSVKVDDNAMQYAMSHVRIGSFGFIDKLRYKYWYWAGLKTKFAAIRFSLFNSPEIVEDLTVTTGKLCSGCRKCRTFVKKEVELRWYHSLIGKPTAPTHANDAYASIVNPDCGVEESGKYCTSDLVLHNISTNHLNIGPVEKRLSLTKEVFIRDNGGDTLRSSLASYYKKRVDCSSASIQLQGVKPVEDQEQLSHKVVIDGDQVEVKDKLIITTSPNIYVSLFLPN